MRALIVTVMLAAALPAHAQTAAHWSQLIDYVRVLANRSIEDRLRIDELEAAREREKAWAADVACKYNKLVAMLEDGKLPKITEGEPTSCDGTAPAPRLE